MKKVYIATHSSGRVIDRASDLDDLRWIGEWEEPTDVQIESWVVGKRQNVQSFANAFPEFKIPRRNGGSCGVGRIQRALRRRAATEEDLEFMFKFKPGEQEV